MRSLFVYWQIVRIRKSFPQSFPALSATGRYREGNLAFYRRVRARHGGPHAATATAHKIARTYYSMLTQGTEYVELGQQAYEQQFHERRLAYLEKPANSMGFHLLPGAAN